MLKVRFPNGQCITYNNAHYCNTNSTCHTLYNNKKNLEWIANAPLDCLIEAVDPCKIENPIIELTIDKAFSMVIEAIENKETGYPLTKMKKLLKNYNSNTCSWK
jgi:hypothetical protein